MRCDASWLFVGDKVRDERAGYDGTVIAYHPNCVGAVIIAWHKWHNEDLIEYAYPGTLILVIG